jgi:hypothetical protein
LPCLFAFPIVCLCLCSASLAGRVAFGKTLRTSSSAANSSRRSSRS